MTTSPPEWPWPLGPILTRARGRLSKRKAAERAGISDGLWRQLESGVRQLTPDINVPPSPAPETLDKIADAFDLPRRDLYIAVGKEPPDDEPVPEIRRHQVGEAELHAAGWDDLSPEDQTAFLRQVAALAEQERQRNAH